MGEWVSEWVSEWVGEWGIEGWGSLGGKGREFSLPIIASCRFSILDLGFWIASQAFSGLLAISFVAPLGRIDII